VDVLLRYSKRADVLQDLDRAVRNLTAVLKGEPLPWMKAQSARSTGRVGRAVVTVRDRLGEERVQELVASFQAGTAQATLATRYGISLSSVKRLLRKHRRSA